MTFRTRVRLKAVKPEFLIDAYELEHPVCGVVVKRLGPELIAGHNGTGFKLEIDGRRYADVWVRNLPFLSIARGIRHSTDLVVNALLAELAYSRPYLD